MKRSARFSYIVLCILLILCFLGCNDPLNGDLTAVQPRKTYSVAQLISEFKSSKQTENDLVIAVTGVVHEINHVNERHTILLKGNTEDETYVICDMNTNHRSTTKAIKSGDSIIVKGLLKGILKDVIMLNCVVIKTN